MKNIFSLLFLTTIWSTSIGQNVGHFYGSEDGTLSTDLKIGRRNSTGTTPHFYLKSQDGGAAELILHSVRWGGGYTWSRESSDGVDRNIAYLYGSNSESYFQLFNHNQEVKAQIRSGGDSFINGGNLGIGTDQPTSKLHIEGTPWTGIKIQDITTSGGRGIRNQYLDGNDDGWQIYFGGHYTGQPLRFRSISNGSVGTTSTLALLDNGRVGIGTGSPNAELTVKGTIHSEEVKVDLSVPGPDYVFEPDYELRTLEETKQFITENKHLPEIPSAKEMEANGVELGDMNMRLLKKIEELTLYQIQLMEEMEAMKKELQELKK